MSLLLSLCVSLLLLVVVVVVSLIIIIIIISGSSNNIELGPRLHRLVQTPPSSDLRPSVATIIGWSVRVSASCTIISISISISSSSSSSSSSSIVISMITMIIIVCAIDRITTSSISIMIISIIITISNTITRGSCGSKNLETWRFDPSRRVRFGGELPPMLREVPKSLEPWDSWSWGFLRR